MSIYAPTPAVGLDGILITDRLNVRPLPPPDHAAENAALHRLAREIARDPDAAIQVLVDAAIALCKAGSAGVSLLDPEADVFRWVAMAGAYASFVGGTTPGKFSPCGTTLEKGSPQLFHYPERLFTYFQQAKPVIVEGLVIPFRAGDTRGTIWVVSHEEGRQFTAEDVRVMSSLGDFTSAALAAQAGRRQEERARALLAERSEREKEAEGLRRVREVLRRRVRQRTKKLASLNRKLRARMAERDQAEEEMNRAKDAAEAANRAKDKFLAVLSHELRTPLSPVVMAIPAMEIDPEMPFKFREDLAMVRRNIDLEVKLIDDLLDLSRVTSGKLRLQMRPVRLHELLRHVVRSSAGETSGKHLRVRHELGATNDLLSGDAARLQQVFWNLLRNAVKFTPDGGDITVRTRNGGGTRDGGGDDRRLLVEVQDSGVGIRPEVLPRVFDAFKQGELRITREFGGLGLGLAIAKAVVEMHGGSIRAASEGTDRGATFTVELATLSGGTGAEPKPAAAPALGRRHPPSRVLLVEDHPDTSRAMATLLSRSGYEVKAVHSVASALQLAAAEPFDIMVSDIGLPDATGYELMEQIRDRYGIRGIALSGYGMEDDVRKSREAGFVEHVVKPVNVVQLQAVIERVLGQ